MLAGRPARLVEFQPLPSDLQIGGELMCSEVKASALSHAVEPGGIKHAASISEQPGNLGIGSAISMHHSRVLETGNGGHADRHSEDLGNDEIGGGTPSAKSVHALHDLETGGGDHAASPADLQQSSGNRSWPTATGASYSQHLGTDASDRSSSCSEHGQHQVVCVSIPATNPGHHLAGPESSNSQQHAVSMPNPAPSPTHHHSCSEMCQRLLIDPHSPATDLRHHSDGPEHCQRHAAGMVSPALNSGLDGPESRQQQAVSMPSPALNPMHHPSCPEHCQHHMVGMARPATNAVPLLHHSGTGHENGHDNHASSNSAEADGGVLGSGGYADGSNQKRPHHRASADQADALSCWPHDHGAGGLQHRADSLSSPNWMATRFGGSAAGQQGTGKM